MVLELWITIKLDLTTHPYYAQRLGNSADKDQTTSRNVAKEFVQVVQYGSVGQEFASDEEILALNEHVVQVSCGLRHSLFVTNHRRVFCCGDNKGGACGLSVLKIVEQMTLIPELTHCNIVETKCGSSFSFFISEGYQCVYVTGNNSYGECGFTSTGVSPLMKMENVDGKKLKFVEPGSYHTVFVTVDNCVYTSGFCGFGSLGQGYSEGQSLTPAKVDHPDLGSGSAVIKRVACGQWHSIVITEEGSVYSWGYNFQNQCGLKTSSSDILSPVLVTGVLSLKKIVDARCGEAFTVFRTESNEFYCYGEVDNGAYLLSTQVPLSMGTVIDYSCGKNFTLFTTEEGRAYALGDRKGICVPFISIHEHASHDGLLVAEVQLPCTFHNQLHVACAKIGSHAFLYNLAKRNFTFPNNLFASQRKGQLCDIIIVS